MSKQKKSEKQPKQPSERQLAIADIRAVPRGERTAEQTATLSTLQAEERRDRFVRLLPKRIRNLKRGVRGVVNMGSPMSYQYTEEEAAQIVAAVREYAAEIARAFTGAPREKGLFDL